ncbi:MAG: class I SAM-dependent methyltransferase [Micromonosporaceae bacterium]|nr:class I SAM-dependent methyltransferase [Micromonosporaceae bacterium]
MSERERRLVFGEVAEAYDDLRAGYPPELADTVLNYWAAGWPPGRNSPAGVPEWIVEVGAGTGKATAIFAGRGARITCIEPHPAMAAVLRGRFAGAGPAPSTVEKSTVEVWAGSFEDFPAPPGGVPLIICAQAWHWVDPAVRQAKAHQVLAPGGVLALFAHQYGFPDREVHAATREAYRQHAPELLDVDGPGSLPAPRGHWLTTELSGSPLFTDATATGYQRIESFPTHRYLDLLCTFSEIRMLPEPRRVALVEAVGAVVQAHGGVIRQLIDTVLVMGRRA